jgi:hypothetical protein
VLPRATNELGTVAPLLDALLLGGETFPWALNSRLLLSEQSGR